MNKEYVNYLSKLLLVFENVRRNAAEEVGHIYNVSFKINGDVHKWGMSIGLRYNHVDTGLAGEFITHLTDELRLAGDRYDLLAYISISRCSKSSGTTGRKTFIPEKRNIFVTMSMGDEVYNDLQAILTGVVDNYQSIDLLISGLERIQRREAEPDA